MKSTLLVIALHLLALYPLFHYQKPLKPQPQYVRVQTVQLEHPKSPPPAPEQKQIVVEQPPPPEPKQVVVEKPSPPKPVVEKKPTPKPVIEKKAPSKPVVEKKASPKATPKPVAQNTAVSPPKKENAQLLALVEQSLSGLEKSTKQTTTVSAPAKIGTLKSETLPEASYQDALVNYLQALLHFPEDGDVRVQLTVSREGKISNVIILHASSGRNERYVCDALASITLPPFGNNFKGESSHSFSVRLTSN